MGFKHISVCDGGWFEWSRDKTNPVESGDINRNFDSNSYNPHALTGTTKDESNEW